MSLSENAKTIYKNLYYNLDEQSSTDVHKRVAKAISNNNDEFESYLNLLEENAFRPNSPCLINAGCYNKKEYDGNLAACFVLDLEDSMPSIINMWATCAKVYSGGGGTGIPITNLREKGSPISSGGTASGPIKYLEVVQSISDTVKSGGKSRRAANLASIKYNHPDILELITCKDFTNLTAVNTSILVDDYFMSLIKNKEWDTEIDLISPNKNKLIRKVKVKDIWESIVNQAWKTGDPGLLFQDTSNEYFPIKTNPIVTTNPCLPSWAPVLTPNGYVRFENLKNKIVINNNIHECSNLINSGKKQVFVGMLESGLKLYCTNNHSISTNEGDLELKNIKIGKQKIKVDYKSVKWEYDEEDFNKAEKDIILELNKKRTYSNLLSNKHSMSYKLGILYYILKEFHQFIDNKLHIIIPIEFGNMIIEEILLTLNSFGIYAKGIYNENVIQILDPEIESLLEYMTEFSDIYYRNIKPLNVKELENIVQLKEFQIFTDIIEDTTNVFEVYDIQVPGINYFVSSSIIVHNCGEVPLPPNSMCNLGSLNLNKYIDINSKLDFKFNLESFRKDIFVAISFLDSIIDKTTYPNEQLYANMKSQRPVGLGIMGFSDILYRLKYRYGSDESLALFDHICKHLTRFAWEASIELCATYHRKSIELSKIEKQNMIKSLEYYGLDENYLNLFDKHGVRNISVTSIAPTGSISISCDCSYAFEPTFALVWSKQLVDTKETLYFVNELFKEACQKINIHLTDELISKISKNKGSCQGIDEIPKDIQRVFVAAHDVGWRKKIEMQAIGQRYITLAISSTCNLPNSATYQDVEDAYILAWESKLKGITIFRDGCLEWQPVNFGNIEKEVKPNDNIPELSPMIRPMVRMGKTVEFNSPHGKIYITGNYNSQNKLFEIFIRMGEQGHVTNIILDALGRVISKALQYGVPTEALVDTMSNCGGLSFFFKLDKSLEQSEQAQSVIDAISKIMDYHFNNNQSLHNSTSEPTLNKCPECKQKTLVMGLGCRGGSCANPECNYSSCG